MKVLHAMSETVNDCNEKLKDIAKEHKLELMTITDDSIDCDPMVDYIVLRRVLDEFLSNYN